MSISLDETTVKIRDTFCYTKGNINQKSRRFRLIYLQKKLSELCSDLCIRWEDLLKKCVCTAVRLHHIEDDLLNPKSMQIVINLKQKWKISLCNYRGCMKLDTIAP